MVKIECHPHRDSSMIIYLYIFPPSFYMEQGVIEQLNKLVQHFSSLSRFSGMPLTSEEDMAKIPITTRDMLQDFTLADCPEKPMCVHATSGSTGQNLFIFHSQGAFEAMVQRLLTYVDVCGYDEDDLAVNLFDFGLAPTGKVVNEALRRRNIPTIPLGIPNREDFPMALDTIRRCKPTVLLCTVSMLYDIFQGLEDNTLIKKILVGGSLFSASFREHIAAMSGATTIYDCYGCNEVGGFAMESKEKPGYFKVFEQGLLVEVEQDGKVSPTGTGNILLTDLQNYSMPFIRYSLGDKVELVEDGGEKFMKFLGRSDNYMNFNSDVVPKSLLVKIGIEVLGHDKFFYFIKKEKGSDKDTCWLCVPEQDTTKARGIEEYLHKNNLRLGIKIRPWHKFPMTASGKYMNIIDERSKSLEDKKLSL